MVKMELSDYRKELDSIDAQMLELFKQRMNTVRGVAEYKKENKLPVLQQGREREILAAAAAGAGEELEDYARTFFATLMDVSRSYQERLTAKGGVISETITDALKNTPPIFPASSPARALRAHIPSSPATNSLLLRPSHISRISRACLPPLNRGCANTVFSRLKTAPTAR
jgi:monofunctional chorismate mutase